MSDFMPSDHDLWTALIFCYHLKKKATESHQMLVEAYDGNALSRAESYGWFEKFQKEHCFPSSQINGQHTKGGRWVPHELTDRQQENRKIACEMLLARYKCKSYLHRIVTGDEKWIHFENSKRNRSYVDSGQSSKSTARLNRFGRKQCCVFSGIRKDQSIMSFSNPAKPLILIATSNNYLI
ncbi:mariner Mos1 transposase [Trichonephila clavipes]|nr:mariner Mos1 transposase [Trichonephila clavipes]